MSSVCYEETGFLSLGGDEQDLWEDELPAKERMARAFEFCRLAADLLREPAPISAPTVERLRRGATALAP